MLKTENLPLYKLINSIGAHVLSEIGEIKKSTKMKTPLRKKRALLELWNWTIDRAEETRTKKDLYGKAVIKTYYGMISSKIFDTISLDDCYKIMEKIANDMINTKRGEW